MVEVAAHEDLAFAVVEHGFQTLPLAVVDYAAEVIGVAGAVGVVFFHCEFHFGDEAVEDFAVYQSVVLGDADLACVYDFAP